MKIKTCINLLLIWGLLFCCYHNSKAQEGATTFADGITVAIKTETKPPSPENRLSDIRGGETSSSSGGKNIIHRVVADVKNKLYFGYDFEVSALADKGKFKVIFKPLSIDPNRLVKVDNLIAFSLGKYPEEMIVDDGDIIFLDTLENPQTKVKISDLIKVTRQKRMFSYFSERKPAKDFTLDDVELQITNLEAFINDKKVGQVGGIAGAYLSLYFQNKGRFIISLFPKPGFNMQKIGVVLDNQLSFTFNGDNYKFVSSSPIVGSGGKWNVWVLHDPDYKPARDLLYVFGAGDTLESFIRKKP